MAEIDREGFGAFVAARRKARGLTQKELAQRLYISDKAVSKWERGLALPDVALLMPLASLLGVTVTELLRGGVMPEENELSAAQVETLVGTALQFSADEKGAEAKRRWPRLALLLAGIAVVALEMLLLLSQGYSLSTLSGDVLWLEVLLLLFGGWFLLFARERLPVYYDENRISAYSQGPFRMNLPGVCFNNSNWPHILRAGQLSTMATAALYPVLYFLADRYIPALWGTEQSLLVLAVVLGMLLPVYIAAKNHQ